MLQRYSSNSRNQREREREREREEQQGLYVFEFGESLSLKTCSKFEGKNIAATELEPPEAQDGCSPHGDA